MQLAEEHGTSSFEAINDRGIRLGSPIAQHLARASGRNALGPAEILDGDGYAMKRSAPLARGDFLVGSLGLAQAESSKMVRYARRVGFSLWI